MGSARTSRAAAAILLAVSLTIAEGCDESSTSPSPSTGQTSSDVKLDRTRLGPSCAETQTCDEGYCAWFIAQGINEYRCVIGRDACEFLTCAAGTECAVLLSAPRQVTCGIGDPTVDAGPPVTDSGR